MFFEFVQIFEGEGEHKFLPKFAHGTLTDTPPPTIQHFSQTFLLFDLNIFDIWHLTLKGLLKMLKWCCWVFTWVLESCVACGWRHHSRRRARWSCMRRGRWGRATPRGGRGTRPRPSRRRRSGRWPRQWAPCRWWRYCAAPGAPRAGCSPGQGQHWIKRCFASHLIMNDLLGQYIHRSCLDGSYVPPASAAASWGRYWGWSAASGRRRSQPAQVL